MAHRAWPVFQQEKWAYLQPHDKEAEIPSEGEIALMIASLLKSAKRLADGEYVSSGRIKVMRDEDNGTLEVSLDLGSIPFE
jgi:hypothetical protein